MVVQKDLFLLIDLLAREKKLPVEKVYDALERALEKVASTHYGMRYDIGVSVNRKTAKIKIGKYATVAEEVENPLREITLEEAKEKGHGNAVIGDRVLLGELPMVDFGRIAARSAKQVIVQAVRLAEGERQYEEFQHLVGTIVSGVVKRVEFGDVILQVQDAELILPKREQIPREFLRYGDKVKAYLYDIEMTSSGAHILVSRTRPEFLVRLFAQAVPEIEEGIIEVVDVARDPGSRAKVALKTHDPNIDPVGAAIGMRGVRVQSVVAELGGEKIDVIQYNPDLPLFVIRALSPATVLKVIVDEDRHTIVVVVPDSGLSIAIGRRGQNVRLVSMLVGWKIDVVTETDEQETRHKETARLSNIFMSALDVDDMVARVLVSEGFTAVEDIFNTPPEDLKSIEGFDEELVDALLERARTYVEAQHQTYRDALCELGASQDLQEANDIPGNIRVHFAEQGVKTLEELLQGMDAVSDSDIETHFGLSKEAWDELRTEIGERATLEDGGESKE